MLKNICCSRQLYLKRNSNYFVKQTDRLTDRHAVSEASKLAIRKLNKPCNRQTQFSNIAVKRQEHSQETERQTISQANRQRDRHCNQVDASVK